MVRLSFFKLLLRASQPLQTLRRASKHHGDCNEKKTRRGKSVNALVKQRGRFREQNA